MAESPINETAARALVDAGGTISASAVETFKATAKSYGLDDAAINATLARLGIGQAPAAAQTEPPAPNSRIGALDPVTKLPSLSNRELEQAAENLTKHWTGDPDVLRQALKNAGLEEVEDKRSDEEIAFDEAFSGVEPGEYDLNGLYVGRDIPVAELAEFDTGMRAALSDMEVPASLGRGIADELISSVEKWGAFKTDAERSLFKQEQKLLASRVGHDLGSFDEMAKLGGVALSRLDAETREELYASGALETAAVFVQLARQGQRLLYREQLAQRRSKK